MISVNGVQLSKHIIQNNAVGNTIMHAAGCSKKENIKDQREFFSGDTFTLSNLFSTVQLS